ncbi:MULTISPECIES: hypothetical protein [unclassified Ruegeria]|uniref:hypothetical protein n=1 Tax=unclassified Ruegeria TaxID=2625375 RepID=UPI001488025C|nr:MULTISPECIES: hypothetical protein [unclassified Ruegeria]
MTFVTALRYVCVGLLLVTPVSAKSPIAEVICEPTPKMHDKLLRQFGAKRHATGLRGPEQLMEVWTSKSGDWTMVVTYSTGTSCIVAMGQDWHTRAEDKPARG